MTNDVPRAFSLGRWLERHWLALFNLSVGTFAVLPVLAPVLLAAGIERPALWLHGLYHLACHQWPGRSYFLFGAAPTYSADTLGGWTHASTFVGNPALGWKVAWCERDLAIYGTVFLAGLVYARLRQRVRPLAWPVFLLCLVPIALDGFTQLFGWRESTPLLRTLTGLLAGWAAVWLVYPRIAFALAPQPLPARPPAEAPAVGAERWRHAG